MDILNQIGSFFENLFTHAHFASVFLGVLISTGVTQLAKYPIRLAFFRKGIDPESRLTPDIEVEFHRWTVRLVAVIAGTIGTFFTWPDGTLIYKILWAVAAGLACPMIYSITMHYVPWLGDKASADKVLGSPQP